MTIQTVQEYIDAIEKLKNKYTYEVTNGLPHVFEQKYIHTPNFIYRGHDDHENYQLIPGIFRWKRMPDGHDISEYSQLEFNILSDFISESCRYVQNVPVDDISAWLEVAQHFGVPTRLLDFTQNPLVALYFACCSLKDTVASVWILDEIAYNEQYFGSPILFATYCKQLISGIINWEIMSFQRPPAGSPQYTQYPVIYRPASREERMTSQSSVFMLWSALRLPLTSIISPENYMDFDNEIQNRNHGVLGNIEIPGAAKASILLQLNELGINEKFIYPGLDGVGKYIKRKYSSKV